MVRQKAGGKCKIPITSRFRGIWPPGSTESVENLIEHSKTHWHVRQMKCVARNQELQGQPKDSALSNANGIMGMEMGGHQDIRTPGSFNPSAKLELLLSARNENVARQNLSHSLCLSLYSGLNSGISCSCSWRWSFTFLLRYILLSKLSPRAARGQESGVGIQVGSWKLGAQHDWQFRWRLSPVTNVQNAAMSRNLTIFLVHTWPCLPILLPKLSSHCHYIIQNSRWVTIIVAIQ